MPSTTSVGTLLPGSPACPWSGGGRPGAPPSKAQSNPIKGHGRGTAPMLGLVQAQSQPLQPGPRLRLFFPPFFSPPVSPSVAITHESNESLLFLLSADAASPATLFFFFFSIQSLCICTFKHLRCICPSSVFIFCSSFQKFGRKDGKIEDNRRREKPQTESVLTVVRSKLRPRYDSIRLHSPLW